MKQERQLDSFTLYQGFYSEPVVLTWFRSVAPDFPNCRWSYFGLPNHSENTQTRQAEITLALLSKWFLVLQLLFRKIDFPNAEIKLINYPTSLLQTAVHSQVSQLSTSQDHQISFFVHAALCNSKENSIQWTIGKTALYFCSGLVARKSPIFIHEVDRIFYMKT